MPIKKNIKIEKHQYYLPFYLCPPWIRERILSNLPRTFEFSFPTDRLNIPFPKLFPFPLAFPKRTHFSTRAIKLERTHREQNHSSSSSSSSSKQPRSRTIYPCASIHIRTNFRMNSIFPSLWAPLKIEARHVHEYFIDNTAKHEPSEISNLSPPSPPLRIMYTGQIIPVIYLGFPDYISKGFEPSCTRLPVETRFIPLPPCKCINPRAHGNRYG